MLGRYEFNMVRAGCMGMLVMEKIYEMFQSYSTAK